MSDPTVVPFPQDGRSLPPGHLAPPEVATWKAVVGSRPAGHFGPEIFPLLEAYCTTAMMCDHIAVRLRGEEGIDHALLATYDQMTESLTHLAETLDLLPGGKRAGA